ncbi:unnamed protein product, partial [Ectocarpus sp. 4 AP-2014]
MSDWKGGQRRCGCLSCINNRRTPSAQICLYDSSATRAAADIDVPEDMTG